MSETKGDHHDAHDSAPLITPAPAKAPADINEWRSHMYPVWLAGLLVLILEYTFCTIFVANIRYLWVGVLVAAVLWLSVLLICLCVFVPRQEEKNKWLGRAVVGTVMGVMGLALVGGLIGAHYLEQYRSVRAGTIYTDISPSKAASTLVGATGIEFTEKLSVLTAFGARSDVGVHFGRYSCVAPIVPRNLPVSTISYWAAVESAECCGTSETAAAKVAYSTCSGWDGSMSQTLVFLEPTEALTISATSSLALSGLTPANTQLFLRLVTSIDSVQQTRLAIVLLCYLLPALVALLWLPAFILFHKCGCCNSCGHEEEQKAKAARAASAASQA